MPSKQAQPLISLLTSSKPGIFNAPRAFCKTMKNYKEPVHVITLHQQLCGTSFKADGYGVGNVGEVKNNLAALRLRDLRHTQAPLSQLA